MEKADTTIKTITKYRAAIAVPAVYCLLSGFLYSCGLEKSPSSGELNHLFFLRDSTRVNVNVVARKPAEFYETDRHVIYALPNGNSIEWTMGKQKLNDDDWHVDIQHIAAQTRWLRQKTKDDWIVTYIEASKLSWPAWKNEIRDPERDTQEILNRIQSMVTSGSNKVILSSHSGGGAFINAFIEGVDEIPKSIRRINYIDSNYGYNFSIGLKLDKWLQNDPENKLVVFAYNDSTALYQGRPVVSAKGGTWHKSQQMMHYLSRTRDFSKKEDKNLIEYRDHEDQVLIILKKNPDRGIYHTEQVELNGFIHSMLYATEYENEGYEYFGKRAYEDQIDPKAPEFIQP